ncbi:MAG: substrate-binding domain-containing protein, partial [Christensenella sp.]
EPNSQARSLVGKKEQIIGFFTTYSSESSGATHVTSHFATELTNLVINFAQKRNYKTLVSITRIDKSFEDVEKFLNSGLVRGAILFGYETGSREIERLSQKQYPLVLINQEKSIDIPNIALVNMDDEKWAFRAIERLVEYGHKKILFLSCGRKRLPALRRTEGAKRAYEKYKSQIEDFSVQNGDFNEDIAYDIVKKIFTENKNLPTGIFAANDLMAIGAINALKELGYQVPRDVSV